MRGLLWTTRYEAYSCVASDVRQAVIWRVWSVLRPWRGRQYVPQTRLLTFNILHGVSSEMMILFLEDEIFVNIWAIVSNERRKDMNLKIERPKQTASLVLTNLVGHSWRLWQMCTDRKGNCLLPLPGIEVAPPVVLRICIMESSIWRDMMSCSPLQYNSIFGEMYCLHLQGRRNWLFLLPVSFWFLAGIHSSTQKKEERCSSETSIYFQRTTNPEGRIVHSSEILKS
jgi:hypothetical protein